MLRLFCMLCFLLLAGTTLYGQSAALNAYQTESALLKPSKAGVMVNGVLYTHGKFYRGLKTVLRGEEAMAALEAAGRNKKESLLWFAGGSVLLIGGSALILYSPIAAGACLVLSIVATNRHMVKEFAAADGLQEAIWLHNRRVMEEVVRP